MKQTRFILLSFILALIGFTSCKSDSDKMIEKCNAYIMALDSVQNSAAFEKFINEHRDSFRDLTKAAKKDSIYSKQNIDEAMPLIFDALYKHTEKQEWAVMQEHTTNTTASTLMALIIVYNLRLPYCTKVSELEMMLRNLNRISIPLFTKYQPNQFEMMTLRMGNDWVQSATVRKTEIEEGNLYNSQFLK